MKRTIIFLLTVLWITAVLAGCGAPSEGEQAMEKLIAANTAEALLEQYENVLLSYVLPDGTNCYVFVDHQTYLFTDETHSVTSLFTQQEQCEIETVDGTVYFHRYINPFHADLGAAWRESAFLLDTTVQETVSSYEQKGDILYLKTQIEAKDMSQQDMEYLGIILENGDHYICEYEADAQTHRVLSTEEYILRTDGTRENLGLVTIAVNTERPEYIAEVEAEGKAIDAMPADAVRVITCIVDPGLETEYSVSQTVEKGNYVLFPEDLQGYEIYMDPEGTQPLVNTPGQAADSNFTVYLIKQ